jgi:hypothetical protein
VSEAVIQARSYSWARMRQDKGGMRALVNLGEYRSHPELREAHEWSSREDAAGAALLRPIENKVAVLWGASEMIGGRGLWSCVG